jgi:hypothetical protein
MALRRSELQAHVDYVQCIERAERRQDQEDVDEVFGMTSRVFHTFRSHLYSTSVLVLVQCTCTCTCM